MGVVPLRVQAVELCIDCVTDCHLFYQTVALGVPVDSLACDCRQSSLILEFCIVGVMVGI